jgi:hypothetical protein
MSTFHKGQELAMGFNERGDLEISEIKRKTWHKKQVIYVRNFIELYER